MWHKLFFLIPDFSKNQLMVNIYYIVKSYVFKLNILYILKLKTHLNIVISIV